ncbi:uncharacterized protein LOC120426528 [Culex pipiens pallens]|uniref:uncharacterized protein LOC120426528 n=1 Tax=Culex pipiens pallens TaxID=42434 RepID=UPI001954F70A|nr:uncharacterized protein LOC120426528 [Culex pipiens pallens]
MVSTPKRKASVTSDSCDSGDEESRKRTKRSTPEEDEALFRLEAEKNFKGQKSSEKRGFLKIVGICVEDILRYVWDHCVEFVYKGAIFEENRVDGNVVTQLKQDNANLLMLVKAMGDRIESLESQLTSHEEMITAMNGTEYPAALAEQVIDCIDIDHL